MQLLSERSVVAGRSSLRWPALRQLFLLVAGVWFGLSARSVYQELAAGRDDLVSARASLAVTDLAAAQESFSAAAVHASSAAAEVQRPMWDVAVTIPIIGATPEAVRAVASSLDQALSALTPAVSVIGGLDPDALVAADGTIDLAVLQVSGRSSDVRLGRGSRQPPERWRRLPREPLETRSSPKSTTRPPNSLSSSPSSMAHSMPRSPRPGIALPLLGADGPKRYFVGVLNPNEARGTGGFLGTYVILLADSGRITVEQIGSNSDLPTLPELPESLGQQYLARYGEDPRLVGNMNISPHFPAAAELWLASWKAKTGEALDGAFAADVVALGDMVTATGQSVSLPSGDELTGEELTEFAISGIYEEFPQPGRLRAAQGIPGAGHRRGIRSRQVLAEPSRSGVQRSEQPSPNDGSNSGRPTTPSKPRSSKRAWAARWAYPTAIGWHSPRSTPPGRSSTPT